MSKRATGKWDFWIDRGGTFTDIVARDPDGAHPRAQAAVGEPRRLSRRRHRRHPRSCWASRPARRSRPSAIAAVKMGTTVATNALLERKGDRTLLLITRGFRDALQDRLPGAARHLRQEDRQAGDALRARRRGRRARARRRHGRGRARPRGGRAATSRRRGTTASARSPSSSCTPGNIPSTSGRSRALAREHGLPAGLGQPRGLAADQARRPRRHHRGRRLSVADPAALRRQVAGSWARPPPATLAMTQTPRSGAATARTPRA